ncbi:MAG: vWA domain-containing protein [Vicinamibacterales bacterium]
MTSCPFRPIAAVVALVLAVPGVVLAQARERVAFVALVDERSGAPVDEWSAGDIVIREDKVAREVLRITPATGPMPIAILVDTSAAAEPAVPDLRNAIKGFVGALGGLGPTALISFGERPTVIADYSNAAGALDTGIGRIFSRPGSGATLIEAVLETARGLGRRESERAAIVVVAAGGPELSTMHHAQALDALRASGATLHVVTLAPPGRARFTDEQRERDALLDRGVRLTGGLRRDVLASIAFAPALADVARVLTHQRRVVYARPQSLIPPETLEVTAARPGFVAYGTAARGQSR